MKNHVKFSLVSIVASSILIGCGGGGSSVSSTAPEGNNNSGSEQNTPTTITGKAVDGYLQSAIVCLDLNQDGFCQVQSEPVSNTDNNGNYSLTITEEHKKHENYSIASILAYDGKDSDTGQRFTGKLQAPNDGTAINITPISTLVTKAVKNLDKNSSKEDIQKKIQDAKQKVKKVLKIPDNVDIGEDPVALKEQGNEELINASLSLQKAAQTFAKAALSDSSNTKDEDEVIEDVFTAFADGLEEIDDTNDSELGLDKLIDKTKEVQETKEEDKRLIPQKALKVANVAKKIANKIETALKNLDSEDELEQLSSMIENDLKKLKEEFDNFDENSSEDFTSNIVDLDLEDGDDIFKEEFDWVKEAFIEEFELLNDLKVLDEATLGKLADELKALQIKPHTLYKEETLKILKENTSIENVETLANAIEKQIEEWKKLEEEKEIENSQNVQKFTLPMTVYSIEKDHDYYNGLNQRTFKYEEVSLSTNTIDFKEYVLENGTWKLQEKEVKSNYYLDSTGTWKLRTNENEALVLNDDGTITLPAMQEQVALVKNKDISNKKIYFPEFNIQVQMPEGSNEYIMRVKSSDDAVFASNEKMKINSDSEAYISSYAQLIENRCGNRWFRGFDDHGLAFGGTYENGVYTCESNATSGKIFEVKNTENGAKVVDEHAGTWKIETIRNQEVLVVRPYDIRRFAWDDDKIEYPIFAKITEGEESAIHQGNMQKKGHVDTFNTFNNVAIEAIKAQLSKDGNKYELTNYVSGVISKPTNGDVLYYGEKAKIQWDKEKLSGEKVNMYILHDGHEGLDPSSSTSIKDKRWHKFAYQVNNAGVMHIDPAFLHANGDEYKILLITDTGNYSISEGLFTVKQKPYPTSNLFKFTSEYLDGKTFYNVFKEDGKYIKAQFTFTAETFTLKEGEKSYENVKYSITEEGFISFTTPFEDEEAKTEYIKGLKKEEKFILVQFDDKKEILDDMYEHEFFFLDEQKADEYIKSMEKPIEPPYLENKFSKELVAGKTLYRIHKFENETCISEQTYTDLDVSVKLHTYKDVNTWTEGCSKDIQALDKIAYEITQNYQLKWANDYALTLVKNYGYKYEVKDDKEQFYLYLDKNAVNNVIFHSQVQDFKFTSEYLNTKELYFVHYEDDKKLYEIATFNFTDTLFSASKGEENYKDVAYTITKEGYITFTAPWDKEKRVEFIKALYKNDDYISIKFKGKDGYFDFYKEDKEFFYFDKTKAQTFVDEKNKEIKDNSEDVTLSGTVNFVNEDGTKKDIPNDAFIRIVSMEDEMKNDYNNGFDIKINEDGSYSKTQSQYKNTYKEGEMFQVVIYKNHIETDKEDWNCGEDVYKFHSSKAEFKSWENIEVKVSDYQDRSNEICKK